MQEPQYVVPRIDMLEQPMQTPPPPNVKLNRIGVVGTFSWGPVGVPTRVYSEAASTGIFGGYKQGLTGWVSLHGIFKQNQSQDVTIVRVTGATAAKAALTAKDASNANSMVVTALYPGTKPISASFQAGTNPSTTKLIVVADGTSKTYDNLTLANCSSVADPNVSVAAASGATQLPAPIASTPLTGGDDGATTVDNEYIGSLTNGVATGLTALASVPVNIVLCAQQSSVAIQAALLTQGANSTVSNGYRFPILNMPQTQAQAATVTAMAGVSGIRGIVASPWGTFDDLANVWVGTDGHYAGVLANILANSSPSNQVVKGLASLYFNYSDDDVYALTQARVSPMTLDQLTGNYVIRNGVSTFVMPTSGTSDDWSQINVRREFDKIETEIYLGTQWAKSNTSPNLPTLLADWIDELLRQRKNETQEIADYKPTVGFRDSTNPRRVVTQISIKPDWAADFIDNYLSQWNGS